jgi:hypothetical protein
MRGELLSGYRHKWFRNENTPVVIHLRHIFTVPHLVQVVLLFFHGCKNYIF